MVQMKYSNFIWNEFIYGDHWISLNSVSLSLCTTLLLNLQIKLDFLLIVYLGTLSIYRYNHYKEIKLDELSNSGRTTHLKKYKDILPFTIVVFVSLFFVFLTYYGNLESIFFGIILLLLGFFFTDIFKKITKRLLGFKSFYTSVSFSLLILFNIIYYSYIIDNLVLFFLLFCFLRFFIGTSYCDIKDMKIDKKRKLLTFPLILGKECFLTLIQIINLISLFLVIIAIFFHIFPSYTLMLSFAFFYSFYYVIKSRCDSCDSNSMFAIIVDGEFIYWPFLLLIGLFIFS
jgi:4-hydroxybenzoate polyprenyltransferase